MRNLTEPEPVLVECPRGEKVVRIRPVFRTDAGAYAIVDSVPWEEAGTIWQGATKVAENTRSIWRGVTTGGTKVKAETKPQVIAALLDARDEFEVTLEDTMPALFEMEDEQ